MSRCLMVAAGFVCGSVVAAGLVLLLAPQSGEETQQMIRDRAEEILAEGRQAAADRRLELTAQLEVLKKPGQ